jgi:hypothetical protein
MMQKRYKKWNETKEKDHKQLERRKETKAIREKRYNYL